MLSDWNSTLSAQLAAILSDAAQRTSTFDPENDDDFLALILGPGNNDEPNAAVPPYPSEDEDEDEDEEDEDDEGGEAVLVTARTDDDLMGWFRSLLGEPDAPIAVLVRCGDSEPLICYGEPTSPTYGNPNGNPISL
jgi:hypothetical protein